MVRPEEKAEARKKGTEPYSPPEDYIDQDYNGLWFVLNHDGFPVSPAFKHREEAVAWKNQLI